MVSKADINLRVSWTAGLTLLNTQGKFHDMNSINFTNSYIQHQHHYDSIQRAEHLHHSDEYISNEANENVPNFETVQ